MNWWCITREGKTVGPFCSDQRTAEHIEYLMGRAVLWVFVQGAWQRHASMLFKF